MDIINSSPQQSSQNLPDTTPETQPPESQTQVHEPVVNHVRHGSKKRAFLRIFLTLVVAVLAAVGVYFWQQGKNSDLQSQLNAKTTENMTLQQAASAAESENATDNSDTKVAPVAPTSTTSEDLIPGNTDTNRTDGRVLIEAVYKMSLNPSAVWIEYGTSPTKLDKSTTKITQELGLGEPGEVYATGRSVSISNTLLTPGTNYYYRTAATVGGKTLYSGVASFITTK